MSDDFLFLTIMLNVRYTLIAMYTMTYWKIMVIISYSSFGCFGWTISDVHMHSR